MSAAPLGPSVPPLEGPSSRSVPLLGKIAITTGLVVTMLLFVRLVQVHSDGGPGELLLAVVYGAFLVAPFLVCALASRRASPRGLRRTWMVAAAITAALAWTSVSVAFFPLAALALALFLASFQIKDSVPPATGQAA